MKVLGLTISREGSKRLPGKNMKLLCGKPLLEWTLLALENSKHILGHYLVTDSEEQAKLAEGHGFTVVWQETAEIDMAEAEGRLGGPYAMRRGLEAAQKDAGKTPYNVIVPVLPTMCLRKPDDIDRAIDQWLVRQELPVVGGFNFKDLVLFENKEGIANSYVYDNEHRFWEMHGCVWVGSPEQYMRLQFKPDGKAYTFQEMSKITKEYIYPMEQWQRYDIDYPEDWDLPEYFMEKKILKGDPDVYKKYREEALSEYGFQQHAAQYNKGVEQNLLPAEYRNSFFNHMQVYLECMKAPEPVIGWELNELKKDDKGNINRNRMKLIRARNGCDIFAEGNVLAKPEPAFIIGSGPSLDEALPLMKDWKGATFCSTSQASSLVKFGHDPSHMIAYDINTRPDEQNWVDTWEGRRTVMVTHPGMYPGTLDSWPGKRMYFKSMDTSNFFFTSVLPVAYGDVIPSHMFLFSCSVSAQMSIAHALGYSPLFFVGCDFAADRFRKWTFDHDKKGWICDPEAHVPPGNYLTAANGVRTDAMQAFYKRSVLCVWRIDRSGCLMTSTKSIITEMPTVDIGAVIAHQGKGYEKYVLTDQQTDDVSEKYLARFNQFVLRFDPDANGKVSYRILESGQGGDWEEDVKRYLSHMMADIKASRMNLKIDLDANMKRFAWLKQQNVEEDARAPTRNQ